MRGVPSLLSALFLAQPVFGQNTDTPINSPDDCTFIGGPVYMCDPANNWANLDLPEDLSGIGLTFSSGIDAQVTVVESPWVGIQVRAQKYSSEGVDGLISKTLTKIDGYPAITYIFRDTRDEKDVVAARTELLLYRLSISAETTQAGTTDTAEHSEKHRDMLAGILYYWDL